jgi:hypothetical protein
VIPEPGGPLAWVCRRTQALLLRRWPEGGVVYDAADGSLSAVSPVAAELIERLLDGQPVYAEALARYLLQATPEPEDIDGVNQHLAQFEHMGFIERMPS